MRFLSVLDTLTRVDQNKSGAPTWSRTTSISFDVALDSNLLRVSSAPRLALAKYSRRQYNAVNKLNRYGYVRVSKRDGYCVSMLYFRRDSRLREGRAATPSI